VHVCSWVLVVTVSGCQCYCFQFFFDYVSWDFCLQAGVCSSECSGQESQFVVICEVEVPLLFVGRFDRVLEAVSVSDHFDGR